MNCSEVASAANLIALERERCSAMVAADRGRFRDLLHRDLLHVHAMGQVDTYESYMATGGFSARYLRVERFDDLHVRILGDSALMTGRQLLELERKDTGDRMRIDSRVMQVWVQEDGRWQQIAFQTTPTEISVERPI